LVRGQIEFRQHRRVIRRSLQFAQFAIYLAAVQAQRAVGKADVVDAQAVLRRKPIMR